jgi:flavin reductase (DIM6/NTAB) family NADH-FMN oxidoreductase RutF
MTPSISSHAFRDALAQFASGVTVVTANGASGPSGFTATGFASVSLAPPLVLVCVRRGASSHSDVVGAAHFAVNILEERQAWIAQQFARSATDRFEGIPLARPENARAPLIEGALAQIQCHNHERHDGGDHTILIGEVVDVSIGTGRPLLHFARHFGVFVAEAQTRPGAASAGGGASEGRGG